MTAPYARVSIDRWLPFAIPLVLLFCLAACSRDTPAPPSAPPETAAGGPVRLVISQAGIYQLTAADLQALGLAAEPQALRLTNRGRPQPMWLSGQGDELRLRFYAEPGLSRYAAQGVYWLALGDEPGRWMAEPDGTPPAQGDDVAPALVLFEENLRYSPLVETGDHFFWQQIAAPGSISLELNLSGVAPGPGRLRLEAWGSTDTVQDLDHQLQVSLNGQFLAETAWSGIARHTLEAEVPAGLFQEGTNTLEVTVPGGERRLDVSFLDWIEMTYPRRLAAQGDLLAFTGQDGPLSLNGFSGPVAVFDVTDPEEAALVAQGDAAATFSAGEGRNYLAVGPLGYLRPDQVVPVALGPDLQDPAMGAEYLAVGPADLLEPLAPLLEWRTGQGLSVRTVDVQALYDQFNHGYSEPEAVQAFVQAAFEAWDPAPRYLLLVGDSTYDPRGEFAPAEANRLPSFLISTVFGGETASDVLFGQVNEDLWPEVAVGRLPARTPDQVRVAVEKILAYEGNPPPGDWQGQVLAVADGQSASFAYDAQRFLDGFSSGYQTELFAPAARQEGAPQELRDHLAEGSLLVAYFGHGSVSQWGRDGLFTTDAVAGLGNGDRLPVVINMTCLTGLFTHPEVDSLAESLLWERDGGAVAVLAPTSLTLPGDQGFLSDALVGALQMASNVTLGDALLQARRGLGTETDGERDVMLTFLLFGDPALRLPK